MASAGRNHPARSTSGKSCCRPDFGGHSMEKVLLWSVCGSNSPSIAHAAMVLPPGCLNSPSCMNRPSTDAPVSSLNSRFAAESGSSSDAQSPLGIDDTPASFFCQNGPPGWTRRTASSGPLPRYMRMPALFCATLNSIERPGPGAQATAGPALSRRVLRIVTSSRPPAGSGTRPDRSGRPQWRRPLRSSTAATARRRTGTRAGRTRRRSCPAARSPWPADSRCRHRSAPGRWRTA